MFNEQHTPRVLEKGQKMNELLTLVKNYDIVIRSDEGRRQGAWIFQDKEGKRAVVKIHKTHEIEPVLKANEFFERVGLVVPFTFVVPEDSGYYEEIFNLFLEEGECESTMKSLYSNYGSQFLIMEFMDATTFSDFLEPEYEDIFNAHIFWDELGSALFSDMTLGNLDRLITVNTGNWMIDRRDNSPIFIDNDSDSDSVEEQEDNIRKILERKFDVIVKIIQEIHDKTEMTWTTRQMKNYLSNMYRGFVTSYARLCKPEREPLTLSLREDTETVDVAEEVQEAVMNPQFMKLISSPRASALVLRNALSDISSGDVNKLNLCLRSLQSVLSDDNPIISKLESLIVKKKEYKSTRDKALIQDIKQLTQDVTQKLTIRQAFIY